MVPQLDAETQQTEKQYLIPDKKLKIILDNAGLGIIVLNNKNEHLMINPTFCGITGFEQEEIIGKATPAPYWPKAFTNELTDILNDLRRNQYIRVESYLQRKDGKLFPALIIGSIIQDEEYNSEAILIIEDVTRARRTERELQLTQMMLIAINKDLERKIQGRTEEIERLLKQKDEFINQLGHDLKNPLAPLVNLLPVLEKQDLNPKSKEMLEVINRNVQHMKNLIVKTLELARLNSPNIKLLFERLNVREQCESCILKNTLQFQEKNITIENMISNDIFVKADKLRLIELFDNILSNAIKYSPENSMISLYSSTNERTCTISIKDNGMGMSPEQINHIFDEFYKADDSRHDFDSSGLGMTICKRIIEKHQGRIWAESEGTGKGTTLHFTLYRWEDNEPPVKEGSYQLQNIPSN
jgi:PAS domain S-box-containing protein